MRSRQSIWLAPFALLMAVGLPKPLQSAETTGWIAAVDFDADLLTLHDGQSFDLPEDIGGAILTEGTQVRITYSTANG